MPVIDEHNPVRKCEKSNNTAHAAKKDKTEATKLYNYMEIYFIN